MQTLGDITKEQLILDLTKLRGRISELEQAAEGNRKFQEELSQTRSLSDFSCVIIESAAKRRTDDRERQSVQTMR